MDTIIRPKDIRKILIIAIIALIISIGSAIISVVRADVVATVQPSDTVNVVLDTAPVASTADDSVDVVPAVGVRNTVELEAVSVVRPVGGDVPVVLNVVHVVPSAADVVAESGVAVHLQDVVVLGEVV